MQVGWICAKQGVGEECASLVALPGGRTVGVHGVGAQEVGVAITAGGEHHGVGAEAFDLAVGQVAGDDAFGFAVDDDQVEHLVAGGRNGRAAFPTGQRRQSRCTLQQRRILLIFGFLGRSRKIEQVFFEQEIVEVGRQVIGFFLGTCNHNVKRTCRGALHRMGYIDSLSREYHRI